MMIIFLLSLALGLSLALPVNATEVDPSESIPVSSEPALVETQPVSQIQLGDPALYSISGSLSGGYYFDCNCSLGTNLRFYVPVEWSQDALSIDSSGAPVNMSTSTLYLYCPAFPEYTFSASRFNTVTYRGDGNQSTELRITSVTDSNINFLQDTAAYPGSQKIGVIVVCLLLILVFQPIFFRR